MSVRPSRGDIPPAGDGNGLTNVSGCGIIQIIKEGAARLVRFSLNSRFLIVALCGSGAAISFYYCLQVLLCLSAH